MLRLFDDAGTAKIVYDTLEDPEGSLNLIREASHAGRRAFRVIQKFYSYGDDFWRIMAWTQWTKRIQGWGHSLEEAKLLAAERVRETYPSYANLPRSVQGLRRNPLFGPFVGYQASLFVTSYQQARLIKEDFASDNPKRKADAVYRLFSLGLGFAAMEGLAALSSMWVWAGLAAAYMGFSDDERPKAMREASSEAFREAVATLDVPFRAFANRVFLGVDEKGRYLFMDVTHTDFYGAWRTLFNVWTERWGDGGPNVAERLGHTAKVALGPFIGEEMLVGPAVDVIRNEDDWGQPIAIEGDSELENFKRRSSHVVERLLPGFATQLWSVAQAARGVPRGLGRERFVGEEAAALLGFRVSRLDPKKALYGPAYEFKDRKDGLRRGWRAVILDPSASLGDIRDAYMDRREDVRREYGVLSHKVLQAEVLGVWAHEAQRQMVEAGVSEDDAGYALAGQHPAVWAPWSTRRGGGVDVMHRRLLDAGMDRGEVDERIKLVSALMGMEY